MKMEKKNTIEYISWCLATNDRAVEKAILVLYKRQTPDEQATKSTRHRNNRGFNSADARIGTYLARHIRSGNRLTGKWLLKGRELAYFYIGQLIEEATFKMEREANQKIEQERVLSRIECEAIDELATLEAEAMED